MTDTAHRTLLCDWLPSGPTDRPVTRTAKVLTCNVITGTFTLIEVILITSPWRAIKGVA